MIRAAGLILLAPTGRALFLQRADGTWDYPGGCSEPGESAPRTARREAVEETGYVPAAREESFDRLCEFEVLGDWRRSDGRTVVYSTFVKLVPREFRPVLSHEHVAWAWLEPSEAAEAVALHRGVAEAVACLDKELVQVFHSTDPVSARRIVGSGFLRTAAEPDVYVSSVPQNDYGTSVVAMLVPGFDLELDDEFPSGRQDFRIHVGRRGALPVLQAYIVGQ